jgi:hypothetical protein
MATKRTPKNKTGSAKKVPKKRASKAPAKKVTKKRASKAPRKETAKRPPRGQGPAKSSRPTTPAKRRAKKAASVPVSVPTAVPPRKVEAPSHPASYLEGVPHDHAELVSGLLQVIRGAAKDLKTLVTQAIEMSNQKNDRFGR